MLTTIVLVLSSCAISCHSYSFNKLSLSDKWPNAPTYPRTCCQLEWTNVTLGQPLPKYFIKAGNFMNRDFGFTRTKFKTIDLKSDQPHEKPNWLSAQEKIKNEDNEDDDEDEDKDYDDEDNFDQEEFPILTNPNKCIINWQKARFINDEINTNDEIFFPSSGNSQFGDFVSYQDKPGFTNSSGGFWNMTSVSDGSWIPIPDELSLLYVDCFKSIPIMSTVKLHSITYDEEDLQKILESETRTVHKKKILINNSDSNSESDVSLSYVSVNNASITLEESLFPYFVTTKKTFSKWTNSKDGKNFFRTFGFSNSDIDNYWITTSEAVSESGSSEDSNYVILDLDEIRDQIDFNQKITARPNTKTIVSIASDVTCGELPVTVILELAASGTSVATSAILKATLEKYGLQSDIEETQDGTLLIYLDATFDLYLGGDLDVDIETESLSDEDEDNEDEEEEDDNTEIEDVSDEDNPKKMNSKKKQERKEKKKESRDYDEDEEDYEKEDEEEIRPKQQNKKPKMKKRVTEYEYEEEEDEEEEKRDGEKRGRQKIDKWRKQRRG